MPQPGAQVPGNLQLFLELLFGGFFISWIGVDKTFVLVFILVILSFIILFQIKRKPVLNKKIGEPMKQSLQAG